MNCVQDQTNIDEATGPELMAEIGNRRAQTDLTRCVLHSVVEKRQLAGNWIVRGIRQTNFSS